MCFGKDSFERPMREALRSSFGMSVLEIGLVRHSEERFLRRGNLLTFWGLIRFARNDIPWSSDL